jgi:hypothetical protein
VVSLGANQESTKLPRRHLGRGKGERERGTQRAERALRPEVCPAGSEAVEETPIPRRPESRTRSGSSVYFALSILSAASTPNAVAQTAQTR